MPFDFNNPEAGLNEDEGATLGGQSEEVDENLDNPEEGPEAEGYWLTAEQVQELQNGQLMQKDYTQKTQELAEQKRQWEAEKAEYEADLEDIGEEEDEEEYEDVPAGITVEQAMQLYEEQAKVDYEAKQFFNNHPEYIPDSNNILPPERQQEYNQITQLMERRDLTPEEALAIVTYASLENSNRTLGEKVKSMESKTRDSWGAMSDVQTQKNEKAPRSFDEADAKAREIFEREFGS